MHKLIALDGSRVIHRDRGPAADPQPPADCRISLFLGDSITYSGQYIEFIDASLRLQNPAAPSRTDRTWGCRAKRFRACRSRDTPGESFRDPICTNGSIGFWGKPIPSGRGLLWHERRHLLSAERRADGKIPGGDPVLPMRRPRRPRPKCCTSRRRYSMRCRSKAKRCRRAWRNIRSPTRAMTMCCSDTRTWLLGQKPQGWDVVDVHGPMKQFLADERQQGSKFPAGRRRSSHRRHGTLDHCPANPAAWGVLGEEAAQATSGQQALATYLKGPEVLKLVEQRQRC